MEKRGVFRSFDGGRGTRMITNGRNKAVFEFWMVGWGSRMITDGRNKAKNAVSPESWFPNSCLGTHSETPFRVRRRNGVSRTCVPKQEFGNECARFPDRCLSYSYFQRIISCLALGRVT